MRVARGHVDSHIKEANYECLSLPDLIHLQVVTFHICLNPSHIIHVLLGTQLMKHKSPIEPLDGELVGTLILSEEVQNVSFADLLDHWCKCRVVIDYNHIFVCLLKLLEVLETFTITIQEQEHSPTAILYDAIDCELRYLSWDQAVVPVRLVRCEKVFSQLTRLLSH